MFIRGYARLCEAPLPKITFQRFIMKAKVSLMFTTMSLTKESQKGIIQLMEQIEVNRRFLVDNHKWKIFCQEVG